MVSFSLKLLVGLKIEAFKWIRAHHIYEKDCHVLPTRSIF